MEELTFGPVRFIPGPNGGQYPHCNALYLAGDKILIDPAADRDRLRRLRREEGVREVWLSHWHEDHFRHLDLFDDLPLRMHPADAPPLAGIDAFLDAYGLEDPVLRERYARMLESSFHFRARRPRTDLTDGLTLALSGVTVQILHTPGHTPGHLCFFFEEPAALFLGDYDLTPFGPWYGDRESSLAQTEASLARLRRVPARVWLAGHGTGVFTRPPAGLWDDYRAVIARRERQLIDFLVVPRRLEEIVAQWIVYRKPRDPIEFYRFAEAAIVGKHLRRMVGDGRAAVENGRYCLLT